MLFQQISSSAGIQNSQTKFDKRYVDRKTVILMVFLFHKYEKTSILNPLGDVKESIFVVSIECSGAQDT